MVFLSTERHAPGDDSYGELRQSTSTGIPMVPRDTLSHGRSAARTGAKHSGTRRISGSAERNTQGRIRADV